MPIDKELFMKKLIIGAIAATTLLAGCSTNRIKDHVVEVGNMGDVSITNMTSMRVNGLLVSQGYFHNDGSKAAQGYYRCQFYDANKMQVGDPQQWQLVTIYPKEDQAVKCMATQLEATDFKIEFSNDASNVTVYK
jgi:uncharacterized protein YcfL